jgi:fused signal recognition particle receptor
MGLFDKLKDGLRRTNRLLNTDIRDLFKSQGRLVDEAFLEELYAVLIKTDIGVEAGQQTIERLRTKFRGRVVEMDELLVDVKQELKSLLVPVQPLRRASEGPTVILVAGVNGAGKTTSIAKLARWLSSDGSKVVLGAADTFRAAAVEQLTIWASRLGVDIVRGEMGGDPASVAHRAVARAQETQADFCIIDTAGRLQTQQNLMAQLAKIGRVIGKLIPDAPHETLLVLDATTGQNAISQAEHFTQAVTCTGIILAKVDGTAKGGVVIAIRRKLGLSVKFVGTGETAEDLAPFDADSFVEMMFEGLLAGERS